MSLQCSWCDYLGWGRYFSSLAGLFHVPLCPLGLAEQRRSPWHPLDRAEGELSSARRCPFWPTWLQCSRGIKIYLAHRTGHSVVSWAKAWTRHSSKGGKHSAWLRECDLPVLTTETLCRKRRGGDQLLLSSYDVPGANVTSQWPQGGNIIALTWWRG